MTYIFEPPTVDEGMSRNHPLWRFYSLPRGVTVVKTLNGYYETQFPSQEELESAGIAYLGGHKYEVSAEEAAALTAAGYTVQEISE